MNGRALFTYNPNLFEDDADAVDEKFYDENEYEPDEEEKKEEEK